MFKAFIVFMVLLSYKSVYAQKILVEDLSLGSPDTEAREIYPISQGASVQYASYFNSAFELRQKRRVGVGLTAAGQWGVLGANIELNFTPESSFLTGFGGGGRYSSFIMSYKRLLGGKNLTPYYSVGYSKWYSHSDSQRPIGNMTPAFLKSKYLSAEEIRSGRFSKDFITPTIGIQHTQTHGSYMGAGFFAEVTFLIGFERLSPTPTGALGSIYYF